MSDATNPSPLVITDAGGSVLAIDDSARTILSVGGATRQPLDEILAGGSDVVERAAKAPGVAATASLAMTRMPERRVEVTALAHGDLVALGLLSPTRLDAALLLREISRVFVDATEDEDPLRQALRVVCQATGWSVGEVWAERDGSLKLVSWAAADEIFHPFCKAGRDLRFEPGMGLPGRSFSERTSIWIRDVQHDPQFVRRAEAARAGLRAGVALPLFARDRVVAVLAFFLSTLSPSADEDVKVLRSISGEFGAHVLRHEAETALRVVTERFIDLYQEAPVAFFSVGPDGRLLRVNRRACELVGQSESGLVGRPVLDLYAPTPAGVRRAKTVLARFRAGQPVKGEELEMQRADGRRIWITLWVRPLFDEDGNIVESRSAAIDVTREHEARVALARSENLLSLMVGEVEDYAIYLLDPSGFVSSWNRGARRLLGWTETEAIGKPFAAFSPKQAGASVLKAARAEGRARREGWLIRKGGSRFEAQDVVTALFDEKDGLQGYCVITRDLTGPRAYERELRLAKRAIEQKAAELARSNRDLEQFAYVASHDLQEPLRMVTSYGEILKRRYEDQLDARGRKYLAFSVDGARRMQDMIHDLLAYSRVGTRGRAFARMDLGVAARRALRDLETAVLESEATVVIGKLPRLVADRSQLHQVFLNLIGNAIKFRVPSRPPRVEVGAKRGEDGWVVFVRDNGIGIDPEGAERLFVPFRRLHTREEYPGSGIGLAICRRVVERRGGRIWFESTPGEGTTFFFTIPDAVPESSAALPNEATPQEA